jgi:hypothetical protein
MMQDGDYEHEHEHEHRFAEHEHETKNALMQERMGAVESDKPGGGACTSSRGPLIPIVLCLDRRL